MSVGVSAGEKRFFEMFSARFLTLRGRPSVHILSLECHNSMEMVVNERVERAFSQETSTTFRVWG